MCFARSVRILRHYFLKLGSKFGGCFVRRLILIERRQAEFVFFGSCFRFFVLLIFRRLLQMPHRCPFALQVAGRRSPRGSRRPASAAEYLMFSKLISALRTSCLAASFGAGLTERDLARPFCSLVYRVEGFLVRFD